MPQCNHFFFNLSYLQVKLLESFSLVRSARIFLACNDIKKLESSIVEQWVQSEKQSFSFCNGIQF